MMDGGGYNNEAGKRDGKWVGRKVRVQQRDAMKSSKKCSSSHVILILRWRSWAEVVTWMGYELLEPLVEPVLD